MAAFYVLCFSTHHTAGKFGEHIWRISQWKILVLAMTCLASRLSWCTYEMYRYRYARAATKDWQVLNLTTLTQIRQNAKINSSPNFPAIRYKNLISLIKLVACVPTMTFRVTMPCRHTAEAYWSYEPLNSFKIRHYSTNYYSLMQNCVYRGMCTSACVIVWVKGKEREIE